MSQSHDAEFRIIFETHRDAVWSYCYRRVERSDVSDAVAEVFLVAWRRIGEMPSADDQALPWLYGVARNVVRNFSRASTRRKRLSARVGSLRQPAPATPEMQVVRRAADTELLAAVDRLPPMDQELLRLRTWEELSIGEIADATGLSARAVSSRLARVRKRLARMLDVPESARRRGSPHPVEEGGEL